MYICNIIIIFSTKFTFRLIIIFIVIYLNKVPVDVELRASGTNCSGMLCEPRGIAAVSHRFSLCLLLLLRYMRTQVSGASPSRNVPRALEARESQAALNNQPAGCSIRLCTYILLCCIPGCASAEAMTGKAPPSMSEFLRAAISDSPLPGSFRALSTKKYAAFPAHAS